MQHPVKVKLCDSAKRAVLAVELHNRALVLNEDGRTAWLWENS
jgi:hypothetical protein